MNIDSRPKHCLFFRLALYPPSPYQARSRRDTQDGLRGAVSRRAAILLDHSDPWRHRLGLRILPPGFHLRLLQLGRRRRPILHRESRRFVLVQLTTRPLNTGFAPFNLVDLSVGRSQPRVFYLFGGGWDWNLSEIVMEGGMKRTSESLALLPRRQLPRIEASFKLTDGSCFYFHPRVIH